VIRRRLVRRTFEFEPQPYRPGRAALIAFNVKSELSPVSQSFLTMSGDTVRLQLKAFVEGTDFRLITVPVEIQARIA